MQNTRSEITSNHQVSVLFKLGLAIIVILWLAACDIKGKYPISWEKTTELGFEHKDIIDLGRLILIDYALFDGDPKRANPEFPNAKSFPEDANLLTRYVPIANLQGQDKEARFKESSQLKELYGHVWRSSQTPSTIVVSIRGTSDEQEWIDDAKFELVPFSSNPKDGNVELGFNEIFKSFTVSQPNDEKFTALDDYLSRLRNVKKIIVTGHSLGSSLATLTAYQVTRLRSNAKVQLLNFASPLTGDPKFAKAFQSKITDSIRIVNKPDIVPRMPFPLFGYRHIWHELAISSYSKPDIVNSVLCYHSLNTYLHVLDNSVSLEPSCRAK